MAAANDLQLSSRGAAPAVSVLLPAWNEAAMLGRCLDSLLAIEEPSLEVIVCAGGSDGTLDIARRYAGDRVTVLEQQPGEGKQAALRRCFERSTGDIIYLTDADCVVPVDTFRAVVEPVARGEVAAATGTSWPLVEQRAHTFALFQWSILHAVERRRSSDSTGLLGRNAAVRRDALLAAGAFAEPVPIGTDYHLARALLGLGERIRFVSAAVETLYPTAPGEYLSQQSRWLRNIFLHGTRSGDRTEVLAVGRTVALGAAFIAWPLTLPVTRRAGSALWLAAFATLLGLRVRYSRCLAVDRDVKLWPGYYARLPHYTLLDVLAWAAPLADVAGRRRWSW